MWWNECVKRVVKYIVIYSHKQNSLDYEGRTLWRTFTVFGFSITSPAARQVEHVHYYLPLRSFIATNRQFVFVRLLSEHEITHQCLSKWQDGKQRRQGVKWVLTKCYLAVSLFIPFPFIYVPLSLIPTHEGWRDWDQYWDWDWNWG